MSQVAIFVANGTEPIEAIAPVDILRRGGVQVDVVSALPDTSVALNHGVNVVADIVEANFVSGEYDMIIVPGGDPGYRNLGKSAVLTTALKQFFAEDKLVASICAGPTILADLGLLDGRKATCYPGMESAFPPGAYSGTLGVVKDDNLITASGPAFAMPFGIACLAALEGEDVANKVASGMLMNVCDR